jgi:hypothetical protein
MAEDELLDILFGKALAASSPWGEIGTGGTVGAPTIYVGLTTSAPIDSETSATIGDEPPGNAYARTSHASWNAATQVSLKGLVDNNGAITFPQATGAWGTVTHFFLADVVSGAGNVIGWAALDTSKTIDNGDTPEFATGALNVTLD